MSSGLHVIEIIVVDNGSSDETLKSVADLDIRIFERPGLKGKKFAVLNYGYQQATGEVIMFLDADTRLPKDFDLHIRKCLEQPGVVGGAFDFEFQEHHWYLQLLAAINRVRIRIDHNFLGDQALFCRSSSFKEVGGYPAKLIMESSFLCRELKKKGSLKIAPARICTSARRFLENGFLNVFWFDFKVWIYFLLRLNTDKFGATYWQHNDTSIV